MVVTPSASTGQIDVGATPVTGGQSRTLVVLIRYNTAIGGSVDIASIDDGGSGSNNERWALRSASGPLRIEVQGAGFTSALEPTVGEWALAAGIQDGPSKTGTGVYLAGKIQRWGSGGTIDTNPAYTLKMVGGRSEASTDISYGMSAMWNRALSLDELDALALDPFAIFRPDPRLFSRARLSIVSGAVELIVQSALHAHTADNVALTQANILSLADALHSHTADVPSLVQAHLLAIADTIHAHTVDNITLSTAVLLILADALHTHAVDSPTLIQANILALADALHAHAVDSPILVQANILSLADTLHVHIVDSPTLVQASILALDDTLHTHTAESPTLSIATLLILADAFHVHSVDSPTLTQANILAVAEALHAHLADVPVLIQANTLAVFDTLHGHTADNVILVALGAIIGGGYVSLDIEDAQYIISDLSRISYILSDIGLIIYTPNDILSD